MSVAHQAHFAVEDDAGIKLLLTISKTTLAPHDILMTLLARQPAAFDMHWLYLACGVSGSECGGKLRQDNFADRKTKCGAHQPAQLARETIQVKG